MKEKHEAGLSNYSTYKKHRYAQDITRTDRAVLELH
jgi:hypothetical protein